MSCSRVASSSPSLTMPSSCLPLSPDFNAATCLREAIISKGNVIPVLIMAATAVRTNFVTALLLLLLVLLLEVVLNDGDDDDDDDVFACRIRVDCWR